MSIANELRELGKGLDINQVKQTLVPHELWWSPQQDAGRKKEHQMLDLVRRRAADMRVLEVGYGWGGRTIPGSKVLDLYDPRVGEIDYRLDACNMVGIEDNSFDFVYCCSVLEHIPKFWLAAAEIQRVLKVGGTVWCAIPAVWPYHPDTTYKGVDINFGGDYWRTNHTGLAVLFDGCREVAHWYIPPAPEAGDDPRSGWGVAFVGEKCPNKS